MALVCNLGAAAAAAVADYEMVAGLPEVSGRGDPSGWLKVRFVHTEFYRWRGLQVNQCILVSRDVHNFKSEVRSDHACHFPSVSGGQKYT